VKMNAGEWSRLVPQERLLPPPDDLPHSDQQPLQFDSTVNTESSPTSTHPATPIFASQLRQVKYTFKQQTLSCTWTIYRMPEIIHLALLAPSSKLQASNTKLKTKSPDSKLQILNSKLKTPNSKLQSYLQTPNSKLQTLNRKLQIPNSHI
jgi:hypothetical protein